MTEGESSSTSVGGARGYDGAKKLVGRKWHILVDTEGLLVAVNVHPANIMDRDRIELVLNDQTRARLPRMQHLWLDSGYNGRGKGSDWVETVVGWTVEVLRATHRVCRSSQMVSYTGNEMIRIAPITNFVVELRS